MSITRCQFPKTSKSTPYWTLLLDDLQAPKNKHDQNESHGLSSNFVFSSEPASC